MLQLAELALIVLSVQEDETKFPLPLDVKVSIRVGGSGPLEVSVTVEVQLDEAPRLTGEGLQATLVTVESGGTPTNITCIV